MFASTRVSRGVRLTKHGGVFGAQFQFAQRGVSSGLMAGANVASFFAVLGLVAVVALGVAALVAAFGADVAGAVALAAAPVAVVKNREVNQLRADADKLVEEIRTNDKLTPDEVQQKADAVRALRKKADTLLELTPDAEIQRQGGDEGLTRIPVGGDERVDFETAEDVRKQIRAVAVRGGFKTFGEFMRVMSKKQDATAQQHETIRKMRELSRTITGAGSAEVLLPLQQEQSIFSVSNAQEGILQRARRYSVAGRSLRIPMLEQTEGDNTLNRPMAGKIANVGWVGEGDPKPQREPQFTQRLLEVKKAAATTRLADEILADDFTGQLPSEITTAVGQQVINFFNEQFTIDGATSVATGGPLGALNAANGALLTVDRDTTDTVKVADTFNMYDRFAHGQNAFWIASRRVLRPLMELTLNGNTLVTWLSNTGGLREKPQMMLLGYPVLISDLLPTLGNAGDLGLINPDFYAVGMRQGLTVESSIHEFFSDDITVYRFLARAAGVPLPTSTYAYKFESGAKVDEYSPFVRLGLPASS